MAVAEVHGLQSLVKVQLSDIPCMKEEKGIQEKGENMRKEGRTVAAA